MINDWRFFVPPQDTEERDRFVPPQDTEERDRALARWRDYRDGPKDWEDKLYMNGSRARGRGFYGIPAAQDVGDHR